MGCCDCCCTNPGDRCCPDATDRASGCCAADENYDPVICEQGDQGRCCCEGVCCSEGQYCCDGVCQSEPCEECEGDEDCPEGEKCCDGECVPEDTCCGPCDEENPCPEGCRCEDGECVPILCDECGDECVMFLHGRTGSGNIFGPDGSFESWGIFNLSGFWSQAEAPSATPEDLADKSYALSVGNIACEDGVWSVGQLVGGGQVRTSVSSFNEGLSGIETTRNYSNVTVIVGENGCPTGLSLGDFAVTTGPNGPSVHTPLAPDIVIDCNPLP